ncbi:fibronectin type III domain-containing protein, partial [Fibrobacterota bacterium]
LILYCAFDPKYTDNSGNNSDNVTIVIENGSDVEIVEAIVCASDLDDSIHFYEHLKDNELNLKVQGGSNREFTVNGYVSSTWRYTQSFTADIGEDDTTFVITLKQIDGPVPEVPENIALELLPENIVKITWDASSRANGYNVYRKKDDLEDIDKIGSVEDPELLDSNVLAEHTYHYAVTAFNATGESDTSDFIPITIPSSNEVPLVPQNVEIVDSSGTSITLKWDRVFGAAYYNIYRTIGSGTPSDLIATIDSARYKDEGLTPQTLYSYAVSAKNSIGESQKSTKVSATTLTPEPEIPQSVVATTLSDRSIKVTWDEVAYADEYEIYRSLSETGSYELDDISDVNSFVSSGLEFETVYYYKVKATNSAGTSDFSDFDSAKTLPEIVDPPQKPTNVTAKALSPYVIQVSWPIVANTSSYNIYRSNSSSGPFNKIASPLDTVYNDSGLSENTTYYYEVSAENSGGESEHSDVVSAKTMILITVPTGFEGEALSSSEIELTWNSVTGADEYRVFRSLSQGGSYDEIALVAQTDYTDTGLDANTTYYYKLSAKGPSGESEQTDPISVTTKMPVPDTPDGLTAEALSSSEIRVEFNTVSGAVGYNIYYCESPPNNFTLLTTVGSGTYTHTGLEPETEYFYKVSAYNDDGESALSDSVSATTLASPPDTPTGVNATALSSSEIRVTYNSVSDADGYVIYHSLYATGQYTALDSITQTSYTHENLEPKSTHYYKVSAYNDVGESELSDTVYATTNSNKVAYITNCRECGRCDNYCDVGAIKYQGGTYVVDTDLCDGCGDCISACPYDYIILVDAFEKVKRWIKDLFTGEKKK